jgi:hypothetical protein
MTVSHTIIPVSPQTIPFLSIGLWEGIDTLLINPSKVDNLGSEIATYKANVTTGVYNIEIEIVWFTCSILNCLTCELAEDNSGSACKKCIDEYYLDGSECKIEAYGPFAVTQGVAKAAVITTLVVGAVSAITGTSSTTSMFSMAN